MSPGGKKKDILQLGKEGMEDPGPSTSLFLQCNLVNLGSIPEHPLEALVDHWIGLVVAIQNHRTRGLELKFKPCLGPASEIILINVPRFFFYRSSTPITGLALNTRFPNAEQCSGPTLNLSLIHI